jgi:hypothetical protein
LLGFVAMGVSLPALGGLDVLAGLFGADLVVSGITLIPQ